MIPWTKYQAAPNRNQSVTLSGKQLWTMSEQTIDNSRKLEQISRQDTLVRLLAALRLNSSNQVRAQQIISSPYMAIHQRSESDWVKYSKTKVLPGNESLYTSPEQVYRMCQQMKFSPNKIFISTGDNHTLLQKIWKNYSITTFHDKSIEYEINAAISFDRCCHATIFIGHSRSTFSNLITMKRELLLGKTDNYIYNVKGNQLVRRYDRGVHCEANRVGTPMRVV
jgi:hypothetical protein